MKVEIRRIRKEDNASIMHIIQEVMPEYGAGGFGFAIHDDEVNNMYEAYQQKGSAYFVCSVNGHIVGGGGIGPLPGADDTVCELKKMYFLPEGRGRGYGKVLLNACLIEAEKLGYQQCYLETYHSMKEAIQLYEKNGFERISGALGNTGHFACDTFYMLTLNK